MLSKLLEDWDDWDTGISVTVLLLSRRNMQCLKLAKSAFTAILTLQFLNYFKLLNTAVETVKNDCD